MAGSASLVTDYRFRGVSQTAGAMAVQAGVEVSHASGVYLASWGSSVSPVGDATTEVDVVGGLLHQVGPFAMDVGATGYLYPGGAVRFLEFFGAVGWALAGGEWSVGAAWTPAQDVNGGETNHYYFAAVDLPVADSPWSLSGQAGWQDGVFGASGGPRVDWSAGVSLSLGRLDLGLLRVGTDEDGPLTAGGWVLSLGTTF